MPERRVFLSLNLNSRRRSSFMGFPFKITNPTNILPGESMILSDQDIKSIKKQNEALLKIRGKVIAASLIVEEKLDNLISLIFMGLNHLDRQDFREIILSKETFTFMTKWKVLRDLINRKAIIFSKEDERKSFLTLLKDIIETRDRFAHGEIIFSGTQPQLNFVHQGEQKYLVLDNNYFDGLNKHFSHIDRILSQLYAFIENNMKNGLKQAQADIKKENTVGEELDDSEDESNLSDD